MGVKLGLSYYGENIARFLKHVLRKFDSKREAVENCTMTGLSCFPYFSGNIITIIKSRRLKWAGYVARMGKIRSTYTFDRKISVE